MTLPVFLIAAAIIGAQVLAALFAGARGLRIAVMAELALLAAAMFYSSTQASAVGSFDDLFLYFMIAIAALAIVTYAVIGLFLRLRRSNIS